VRRKFGWYGCNDYSEDKIMKRLALTLAISAMATSTYAAGGKTSILHCGVELGDLEMAYTEISVSKNSKGHGKNHVVGSIDSVPSGTFDETSGEEIYIDYVRAGADCLLEGSEGDLGIDALCEETTQFDGETCGMEAI
jgi:hypothetical protein